MYTPDLMTMLDGTPVTAPSQWCKRRDELLEILDREEYGRMPANSSPACETILQAAEPCCGNLGYSERLGISLDTPKGTFSFPVQFLYPADGQAHPLIIHLGFQEDAFNPACPVERILQEGFALGYIFYQAITTDDGDWTNGLAGCYPRTGAADEWGKIAMWAFAASRAADVLAKRSQVDAENMAVIGHSRLGKTSLVCAAHDPRFRFALINDSGCGGDALEQTKHPGAETFAVMDRAFPFWFCKNRSKYVDPAVPRPFDQHFLVAAIAPRFVYIGSASEDAWADPYSQQLCAVAASPAWALHNLKGFLGPETPAEIGISYSEGSIGYHLRFGSHALTDFDWQNYLEFMKARLQK